MTWPTMWDDDPSAIIEARYTAGVVVWETVLDWSAQQQPQRETVADLVSMPYQQYLKSNHWRRTRERVLMQASWRCRGCGVGHRKSRLEVHHLTYERRGCEHDSDLVALCRSCHQSMHDILPTREDTRP